MRSGSDIFATFLVNIVSDDKSKYDVRDYAYAAVARWVQNIKGIRKQQ